MDLQGNPKYRALSQLGICSLEIRKPSPFDGGIYTCKAINALGEASVDCRVDVKGKDGKLVSPVPVSSSFHTSLDGKVLPSYPSPAAVTKYPTRSNLTMGLFGSWLEDTVCPDRVDNRAGVELGSSRRKGRLRPHIWTHQEAESRMLMLIGCFPSIPFYSAWAPTL